MHNSISLGTTVTPKRNWKQWLCKFNRQGGGGGVVNKEHYGLCEIGELAANMNGDADREEGGHARPSSRVSSSSSPYAPPHKLIMSAMLNNTVLVLKPSPHLLYNHQ